MYDEHIMKPTINEIAALANVAKSTVSKALNGQRGVSEEKRREILSIVKRLDYEPTASARALASQRTGSIALVLPTRAGYSLTGAYWSAIISSISDYAASRSYTLLVLSPQAGTSASELIDGTLKRRTVDGLILGPEHLYPDVFNRLGTAGIPFVFIGQAGDGNTYAVDVDNAKGSLMLVRHLLKRGYTRIACMTGPADCGYVRDRIAGYRSALTEACLAWEAVASSSYRKEDTCAAMRALLRENPDCDALYIAAGGDFFLDCLDMVREVRGTADGLGFCSFDDHRYLDYLGVRVTTARQPLVDIGVGAAQILFDVLAGKDPGQCVRVYDVDIIER